MPISAAYIFQARLTDFLFEKAVHVPGNSKLEGISGLRELEGSGELPVRIITGMEDRVGLGWTGHKAIFDHFVGSGGILC